MVKNHLVDAFERRLNKLRDLINSINMEFPIMRFQAAINFPKTTPLVSIIRVNCGAR